MSERKCVVKNQNPPRHGNSGSVAVRRRSNGHALWLLLLAGSAGCGNVQGQYDGWEAGGDSSEYGSGGHSGGAVSTGGVTSTGGSAYGSGGSAVSTGGAEPVVDGGTPPVPLSDTGTLVDAYGQRMRGTRMVLGGPYKDSTVAIAINLDKWTELKEMGFNTIRAVWVDPYVKDTPNWHGDWTVDQVLPYLDKVVENAAQSGMNLIINYHHVAEWETQRDFGEMAEFWQKVAPRYRDRPRVYYELNNEQAWYKEAYLSAEFMGPMKQTYDQVRADAPERHVIMFSFYSMGLDMKGIADAYTWIDWKSTSVGYHFYGWGGYDEAKELANLRVLRQNYRTICTEWNYPEPDATFVKQYLGYDVNAQALEELGESWVDWSGWDDVTFDKQTQILIPDAKAKGYWWGAK